MRTRMLAGAGALLIMVEFSAAQEVPLPNPRLQPGEQYLYNPRSLPAPDFPTSWNEVVENYRALGFTTTSFVNKFGNTWYFLTSRVSGNTALWSPDVDSAFNCVRSYIQNYWDRCTRYSRAADALASPPLSVTVRLLPGGEVVDK